MGFGDYVVGFIILSVSVGLSLLISVPLVGALVRFRANYNPKALQLDPEGDVTPHTGPLVTSFFGMMLRTKRLEGWAGLYKGLMPTLLSTLVITGFAVVALDASVSNPRGPNRFNAPTDSILGTLAYGIFFMLVSLPAMIITNRTITTPHKLPYFNPIYSLRILLTPTERRRPWLLYLTPGLLASETLHILYVLIILHGARRLLLPSLSSVKPGDNLPEDFTPLRLGIYAIIAIISTVILCPLEVVAIRLSIQRNHASAEFNSVAQEEEGDAEPTLGYAGADEDVIGLRNEKDPYVGFVDCAKSIAQEEGIGALYRAWWLTMLAGIIGAFS